VELRVGDGRVLAIPPGVAHGYQTLDDDTDVSYQMNTPFVPEAARGFRFDDPAFRIEWPDTPQRIMNQRDRSWPEFRPSPSPSSSASGGEGG
jgi:dTDP-4-dehydrorhamnose 3,5-epimerase